MIRIILLITSIFIIVACQPENPNQTGLEAVTPIPTVIASQTPLSDPTITPTDDNIILDLPTCDEQFAQDTLNAIPSYQPIRQNFVEVNGQNLTLSNQPYTIYGVNYYPRDYPHRRFLREMNVESIEFELDLMRSSGLNTLRIYIRHNQLFNMDCLGNGTIPNLDVLNRLDTFIQSAGERNFRLILVLNHEPDLTQYPIYDNYAHHMQQLAFIVDRYQDEGVILAYDLRDNGDADYSSGITFTQEQILNWLFESAVIIRQNAPHQLITAGWNNDSQITASIVDFISFQNFANIDTIRQEIAILTDATTLPILLASVGYNTFDMDELIQREAYQRAFEAIEHNNLAGWVIWTAFDYPLTVLCDTPDCIADDTAAGRYGLWNTSYFPKLALDAVEAITGITNEN